MSSRPSLHEYYISMLELIAARSTCCRRRVAAIVVSRTGKLISIGYNGVPSGMSHCTDVPCEGARDESGNNYRCLAIHAETNAIIQAGDKIRDSHILYSSTTPCFSCAKLIISAGIKMVVSQTVYPDYMGLRIMSQAGVVLCVWDTETKQAVSVSQSLIDEALSK